MGYNWQERQDFLVKHCKKKPTSQKDANNQANSATNTPHTSSDNITTSSKAKITYPSYVRSHNYSHRNVATGLNRTPLGQQHSHIANTNLNSQKHNTSGISCTKQALQIKTNSHTHTFKATDVTALTSSSKNIAKSTKTNVSSLC